MSQTTPELSAEAKAALLKKLSAFQSTSTSSPETDADADSRDGESDAELALRLILESGKYGSREDVERAVDIYVGGKPLAYITNLHPFGDLTLTVRPPVYIPRVETEQWVLLLASSLLSAHPGPGSAPIRILDICTGSGCIPLLLASQGKGRIHVVGLDVDDRALAVARENAQRNGLDEVASFEKLDLFDDDEVERLRARLGGFDLVVSNPPYVSSEDMQTVEGKWHEGKFALQGKLKGASNDDGYSFYRRILSVYPLFLKTDRPRLLPKLVLEVGAKQSGPVQDMYKDHGRMEVYKETQRRRDIGAPKLEVGDMVGTERSVWVYEE